MLKFEVSYADGTSHEVEIVAADLVRFEQKFGPEALEGLGAQMPMTHTMFLIWVVEKRTKVTELTYDEWLDLGADVDPEVLTGAGPKVKAPQDRKRRASPRPKSSAPKSP